MLTNSHPLPPIGRRRISLSSLIWATIEPAAIVATLVISTIVFGHRFGGSYMVLAMIVLALTFPGDLALARESLSVPDPKRVVRRYRGRFAEIFSRWLITLGLLLLLGYATESVQSFDVRVIALWAATTPLVLLAVNRAVPILAPRLVAMEGVRSAIVVGANEIGQRLAAQFVEGEASGINLRGYFDDRSDARLGALRHGPLIGSLANVASYVRQHNIDAIYLSLPMSSAPRILNLLDALRDTTASIYFAPDIFFYDLIQARIDDVNGIPVVAVCETPFYGVSGTIKRGLDLVVSSIAVTVFSPVYIAIALAVKLSSPGPIIFKQRRYGLDGREIVIYKFRTMTVTEDGGHIEQAKRNDSRLTAIGGFLRKSSLDELPQFFNVLSGSMSVVGPRPHAVAHNEQYRSLIRGYMVRHKVKPGITGWAQVNGLRGETDTLDKMQARVDHDLEYLRNWSLALDVSIILRTVRLVARRTNAH